MQEQIQKCYRTCSRYKNNTWRVAFSIFTTPYIYTIIANRLNYSYDSVTVNRILLLVDLNIKLGSYKCYLPVTVEYHGYYMNSGHLLLSVGVKKKKSIATMTEFMNEALVMHVTLQQHMYYSVNSGVGVNRPRGELSALLNTGRGIVIETCVLDDDILMTPGLILILNTNCVATCIDLCMYYLCGRGDLPF